MHISRPENQVFLFGRNEYDKDNISKHPWDQMACDTFEVKNTYGLMINNVGGNKDSFVPYYFKTLAKRKAMLVVKR